MSNIIKSRSPSRALCGLPSPTPTSPTSPTSTGVGKPLTLRRLSVLCKEIRSRDAKSLYPWRAVIFFTVILSFICVVQDIGTGALRLSRQALSTVSQSATNAHNPIFLHQSDFFYIPDSRLLISGPARAGTGAFLKWLRPAVTGSNTEDCGPGGVYNLSSSCWNGRILHPASLSLDQQRHLVRSEDVLRIALTRDPYDRLLSAWKARAACDSDDYGTDVTERNILIPQLLRQASMLRPGTICLSLSGFALVLDEIRRKAREGLFDLQELNRFWRPQRHFFEQVGYHMVFDLNDLSNHSIVTVVSRRLRFRRLINPLPAPMHISRQEVHTISELTASQLYKFALLSDTPIHSRGASPRLYRE